jgi:hypothetical protein
MSMAIAHFAVGTMATALLLALVAPRLLRSPTVLVAGGVWAMVPDVHHVLPTASGLVRSFHMSVWSNVFWFHHYLDRIDPENSRAFAGALVVALVVVLAACELFARMRDTSPVLSLAESGHE